MNLQQLRYLVAAADTGSLSGAARTEQVAQPVVSRALQALARELQVEIFERDGRRVVLTDAGNAVVAAARHALDAVEGVHRTARSLAAPTDLTIVATPNNTTLLSPIVAAFLKTQPAVSLRLHRANDMREVRQLVAAGKAHLGFGDLIEPLDPANGLQSKQIWLAHVVLISPPAVRLPPSVPRAKLGELPLVLPLDGSQRREVIDTLAKRSGTTLTTPVLSTDERSAWISSAQQGIASFLTYEAVGVELDGVKMRPLDPPVHGPVGFLYRATGLCLAAESLLALASECSPPPGCVPAAAQPPARPPRPRRAHGEALRTKTVSGGG
jgi:DNA-binding transcriptional LysR family regulator